VVAKDNVNPISKEQVGQQRSSPHCFSGKVDKTLRTLVWHEELLSQPLLMYPQLDKVKHGMLKTRYRPAAQNGLMIRGMELPWISAPGGRYKHGTT